MSSVSVAAPISPASFVAEWRLEPLSLAAVVLVAVAFFRARSSAARRGVPRSRGLDVVLVLGLAVTVWVTSGFLEARSTQLMWVWATQQLLLLLVVPIILVAGQPIALLRRAAPRSAILRVLNSPPIRVLGHPLVAPVLVPLLCLLMFFGGLGSWATSSVWAAGVLHLLLLTVGFLIALPLLDVDDDRSSLAVGLALGVGFLELILDAFPGLVLRYQTHLTIASFGVNRPPWSPDWLPDQHIAGDIMWIVAELLDLPFLVLAATRWIRADAKEAARIDAELDARAPVTDDGQDEPTSAPWWLDHPELRERFERG